MSHQGKLTGVVLAIMGALLWGIQGPVSQFLFQDAYFSPEWLMGIKMPIAGILILLFNKFVKHQSITAIWHHKADWITLVIYAIFGLAAVQYLYLVTVKYSNAGIATILQSLGTVIIVILTAIFYHRFPNKGETLAVIMALLGTWLLVTKGDLNHLSIGLTALILGLLLALAGALQTMLPVKILQHFNSLVVVGWAMIIGGIIFMIIHPIWYEFPHFTIGTFLGVAFIVLFGTMMSFLCFIQSLNYVSPTVAGLLDTFEPFSATVGSVLFLGTSFNGFEAIGGLFVISTVFILAFSKLK